MLVCPVGFGLGRRAAPRQELAVLVRVVGSPCVSSWRSAGGASLTITSRVMTGTCTGLGMKLNGPLSAAPNPVSLSIGRAAHKGGRERLRHLLEFRRVDRRHRVHDDEGREQQRHEIGVGNDPPLVVRGFFGFHALHCRSPLSAAARRSIGAGRARAGRGPRRRPRARRRSRLRRVRGSCAAAFRAAAGFRGRRCRSSLR